MKEKIKNAIKYLLFLSFGVGLMYYSYQKNKDADTPNEIVFNQDVNWQNQPVLTFTDTLSSKTKYYTIEKSYDGSHFESIDTLKISSEKNYTYTDENKYQFKVISANTPLQKPIYKVNAWSQIVLLNEVLNMDMKWYALAFFLSMISNYSRAIRWQTIIEPLGYYPDKIITFLSVNIMYFSNNVIPRSGEITRCSILYKYEKVPIAKLVGTVLVERSIDFLCLLGLVGLMIVSQLEFMKIYFSRPDVQQTLSEKADLLPLIGIVIAGGIGFLILLWISREKILRTTIGGKVGKIIKDLLEGVKSTRNIKRKWAFIIHTAIIWLMYFGVSYISFFSYEPTANLTPRIAFACLIMGSFGMVAPTAGGIGTWNIMIIFTLVIFGVSEPHAFIYSFVALFMMSVTSIVAGGLSFIALPVYNKKRKLHKHDA